MSRPITAALLSALVFPGAGQFYLGRRARACLFAVPVALGAIYFVRQMLARVMPMVDQITAGTLALDPAAIAARMEQDGGSTALNVAATVMVLLWVASIIDAWWCGRTEVGIKTTGRAL